MRFLTASLNTAAGYSGRLVTSRELGNWTTPSSRLTITKSSI